MAGFLNISFLTFLCVTALGVLQARANALVHDQDWTLRKDVGLDANINKIFDDLLFVIKGLIVREGLDPLKLPDVQEKLDGILGINGVLYLSQGFMRGLSQLKRSGDVVLSYKDKIITLDALLGLDDIDVVYDSQFKYLFVSQPGVLHARLSDTKMRTILKVDLACYRISLELFQITSVGKIDVKFKGTVIDNILSGAINAFIRSYKKLLIETVENKSSEIICQQLKKINDFIRRQDYCAPQVVGLYSAVLYNSDWDNMVDNIPTSIEFVIV